MIEMADVAQELAAIEKMTARELRTKYAQLFGEESRSGNRQWLARRCAWRVQTLAEGDTIPMPFKTSNLSARNLRLCNSLVLCPSDIKKKGPSSCFVHPAPSRPCPPPAPKRGDRKASRGEPEAK